MCSFIITKSNQNVLTSFVYIDHMPKRDHSATCLLEDTTPGTGRSIAQPVAILLLISIDIGLGEDGIEVFFAHLHEENGGVALKIGKDGGLHAIGWRLQLGYSMLSWWGLDDSPFFALYSHPITRQFLAR